MATERDGSWGAWLQGGDLQDLERLGQRLSLEIGCAVHYPAYGKHMFECMCHVTFPVYVIKGGDWNKIREIHKNGHR